MKGLGDIDRRLAIKQDQQLDASLDPTQALGEDDPGLAQLLAAPFIVVNIFRNTVEGPRDHDHWQASCQDLMKARQGRRWQVACP